MAKFYTKDGWLTRYALACGYMHSQKRADSQEVVLTCVCPEQPLYLVRRYKAYGERTFESFAQSLVFARQQFRLAMGEPMQHRYESNSDIRRNVIA